MNRSNSPKVAVLSAFLAASVLGAAAMPASAEGPSAADKSTARDLMREGKELRAKADHAGALKKFRAAFALFPSPITALAVAREQVALGMLVEGRETLDEIARMPVRATESEDGRKAREEAATLVGDLRPRIPVLEITVAGVPNGQQVAITVDGQPVPLVAAEAGFRVNPGSHEIVAKVAGRPDRTRSVTVREGERQPVEITFPVADEGKPNEPATSGVPVAPTPSSSVDAERSSWSTGKTVAVTAIATGVIALGVGEGLGLVARSRYADAKAAHCDASGCDPEGKQATDDARRLGNVGTVVFGIGAVVAVGGVVWWLAAPADRGSTGVTSVSLGVGNVVVQGRF